MSKAMSKRTVWTTVTPLPASISRETVMETLHSHFEIIDLSPLIVDRHPIKPPRDCPAKEFHCNWYQLTDKVQYLPGSKLVHGNVSYNACFHDLPRGLSTHIYAPMGLDLRANWHLGGNLPGEPREAVELGIDVPKEGLWLREDVDMRCNILMTSFVKKTLKKSHAVLVDRLLHKSLLVEETRSSPRSPRSPSMFSGHSGGFHSRPFSYAAPPPHPGGSPYLVQPGFVPSPMPSPGLYGQAPPHHGSPSVSYTSGGSGAGPTSYPSNPHSPPLQGLGLVGSPSSPGYLYDAAYAGELRHYDGSATLSYEHPQPPTPAELGDPRSPSIAVPVPGSPAPSYQQAQAEGANHRPSDAAGEPRTTHPPPLPQWPDEKRSSGEPLEPHPLRVVAQKERERRERDSLLREQAQREQRERWLREEELRVQREEEEEQRKKVEGVGKEETVEEGKAPAERMEDVRKEIPVQVQMEAPPQVFELE